MKIYLVNEIGYEYSDEYHYPADSGGVIPLKAFRVRAHAEEEQQRLNEEARESKAYEDDEENLITEYYKVVEIEVADDDVETYAEARDRVKAAIEASRQVARAAFQEGADKLFEEWSDLDSFAFEAYTPYFNDGSPCTYRVHKDEPDINGEDGSDVAEQGPEQWDENSRSYRKNCEPSDLYKMQDVVADFLDQFDEDDIKAMFGDHVKVTVSRSDGVQTSEYDHD